jgi:hypothetical protein
MGSDQLQLCASNKEILIGELFLKKDKDPVVDITESEDLNVRLEEMVLNISENQFIIQVLNYLTSDYESQLALMERRVGDNKNPSTVDEIIAELHSYFERLSIRSTNNDEVADAIKIGM